VDDDDNYVACSEGAIPVVFAGDIYLHNASGKRKAQGTYFTKSFAVEHLLDRAYPEERADYPVGGVSWYEAAAYAKWADKMLPTEGQWNRGIRYFRENAHVIVPNTSLAVD